MIERGSLVKVFINVQFVEEPKPDFEGYVFADDDEYLVVKSKFGKQKFMWADIWYVLVNWSSSDKTYNNSQYSEKLIQGPKFETYERRYLQFKINNRNKWLEVGQQMVRIRAKYLTKKGVLLTAAYGFVLVASLFISVAWDYRPLLIISGLGAFKTIRSMKMKDEGDFWYRYADEEMVQFQKERDEFTFRLNKIS